MKQKSKNIKRTPKGVGSTQKSYHFYIDDDLIAVVDAQENKTRFINAAIRKFIKKLRRRKLYDTGRKKTRSRSEFDGAAGE